MEYSDEQSEILKSNYQKPRRTGSFYQEEDIHVNKESPKKKSRINSMISSNVTVNTSVLYDDEKFPSMDQDNLVNDNNFLVNLEPDEQIIYSMKIIKINKKAARQERTQLFTNRYLYNLRTETAGVKFWSKIFKSYKIKKRMPQAHIEQIIYSETSDEFIISAPKDYDLHYSSSKRNEIIDYLFHAKKTANLGNTQDFAVKTVKFLHDFCLHPSQVAKGQKRKIESGILKISHDEFEVNFCGKKMVSDNLLDTGNHVSQADFEFLSMLGMGGFSKVYLSRMKKTNELFAVKSIKMPEQKDNAAYKLQIQHERDILVTISHPFIVKLKYAFQSRKRFFLVMAYIQGGEILNYIKRENAKTREERTKFYAAQIALALDYQHKQGVIYGDLKPENILIDKYGYIKLTDFGASKMLNGKHSILGFAGTPDYQAPEVLRNKKITKASDWWTFGILLYEMLFGKSPFYHEDHKMMFKGILSGTPIIPTKVNVSAAAIDLVMCLLKKRPDRRIGRESGKEILDHKFFNGLNLDMLLKKQLMAPILPNIESESSTECFSEKITKGELKLSFEGVNPNNKSAKSSMERKNKKNSSYELLDFDFVEEEYVETAFHESFIKSPLIRSRRDQSNNNLQDVIVEYDDKTDSEQSVDSWQNESPKNKKA